MSIKSVHITNYYHRDSGGISTAYNKLLEGANRLKRYVRLIVPGERTETEEVGDFGRIYYVKAGYSPVFDKRYRVLWPWKTYILDQSPIKKILREEHPDLIEVGEKYTLSLMAGLLRKGIMNVSEQRPMLVHFSCERMDDNVGAFIFGGKASRLLSRAYIRNYLFPMFDFHLTNSEYTAEELREAVSADRGKERLKNFCWRLLRTPKSSAPDRVFVNQCGVDLEAFSATRRSVEKRSQLCREYGIPETAKLLLYAGRISPEKNVTLLPAVLGELFRDREHDYRLLVAGAGPMKQKLGSEFEKAAPGKFRMLGHVNDIDKLADLFANCDAFIHPNPREPFGITPLEAMASGLPVAAPESGGVLSYANDENAWLCEANARSFAAAVRDIFSDEERREAKVLKAISAANRYGWESSVSNLFAAYDRMFEDFTRRRDVFVYKQYPRDLNTSKESISQA